MFGYDSKLFLKEIFLSIGHREIRIEILRQILSSQMDFEPYICFKRIDQSNNGTIGVNELFRLMKINGY
jgi:Ca2+-binding EF-hand superfamily protein